MDAKRAIAHVFERGIADDTGERVTIELVDGKGAGAGLRGCVGWDGNRWRILLDAGVSDWQFWKHCWHEYAHIHYGDVARSGTVTTFAEDRRLLAGGPKAAPDVWVRYLDALDVDAEERADRFALKNARANLDALNAELAAVGASLPTVTKAQLRWANAKMDTIERQLKHCAGNRDAKRRLMKQLEPVTALLFG